MVFTGIILASAAMLALLGLTVWRVFWPHSSRLDHPAWFFLVIFLSMLALRWPQISLAHEINPDESQMLAQGMRYLSHPVPWRDVDGTTSGPLNSLLLSVPIYFGAPANWETARMMLWALNCLTLVFLYLILRRFGTRTEAQFLLMPVILFHAFAEDGDFIHYSSEPLAVLLLSAGTYLLCRECQSARLSSIWWFILGLLCGTVPFAKLQAAPLALFLMGVGLAHLFLRCRESGKSLATVWLEAAALFAGALAVPCLILGVVASAGAWDDFWKSYILASGGYVRETVLTRIQSLAFVLFSKSDFRSYFLSAMGAALLLWLAWLNKKNRLPANLLRPVSITIIGCALSLLCLVVSGKNFRHYALLLIPGLVMLVGLAFFAGRTLLVAPDDSTARPAGIFVRWSVVFCIVALGFQCYKIPRYVRHFAFQGRQQPAQTMSIVGQRIRAASKPGDTISVWGWMPVYYIETGLLPATRDAIGHYIVTEGPYRDYFRKRYLHDLMASKPALFIDAIADNTFCWKWTREDRHESFPELSAFIDENYALWLNVQMVSGSPANSPIRIYVRKDRMAELRLVKTDLNAPADPFYIVPLPESRVTKPQGNRSVR